MFGERKKSQGAKFGERGGCGKCDNAVVGEKLARFESSVRGCIVIMEQPSAHVPQVWSFSPNVLSQTVKNTAVELGIHDLAFEGKIGLRLSCPIST
jgi:hypothetical protein